MTGSWLIDRILPKLGLARLEDLAAAKSEVRIWQDGYARISAEHTALLAKIEARASQAPIPFRSKVSGAQLRRMNEKYNAQVSREQEPRSNSEILKEQANG